MKKIHNHLLRTSRWYAKWHNYPHHSAVHALLFVVCSSVLVVSIIASSHTAQADVSNAQRPQFSIDISDKLKGKRSAGGEEAIIALGPSISTVARGYGVSATDLKFALRHDKTMKIDKKGFVFFEDQLPDPQKASLGDGTIPNNPTTVEIPDELTFKLHSKPSQSAKIWLNFQGATTQNTSWNTNGPIISAPFSVDSDPAFNSTELNIIKAIWRSVAEDYAPFDIDVTTEPTANYSYDHNHFTQVIISPSWEWYGQAGGVSYIGSYTWGDGTPAFVFSGLLNNNAKYISEATSHEAGHTLGLYHTSVYDSACNYVQEYSYGYGSNPGWGPIMGAGYYVGVSQWTKTSEWPLLAGPYGCTNEQDDLSIITKVAKFSADDVGNTASAAGVLNRTVSSSGVAYVDELSQLGQNDVDLYKFTTTGGDIQLTVKAIPPISTLMGDADFRVRLLDSSQTVIAESNPAAVGDAYVEKLGAPSGTYYLEVAASGYLDLTQPGGYSTYGSMGQYQVVGTYVASAPSSDTTAPTVSVTSPANNVTIGNTVSVAATATDNVGVDHVDFYRDTTLIGADSSAPYGFSWDTTQTSNGTYAITAKAYDAAGNVGTSGQVSVTVSNTVTPPPDTTAPLTAVTAPVAGATVSGVTTLAASASDAVGVTKVSFFDGTTLIGTDTTGSPDYAITWDTTTASNGSHTITSKAYDAAGNIGTSYPVVVYVSNVLPTPVVTITSPLDGSVITGSTGNVTIKASATAPSGIYRISIYADDKYVTSVRKSAISYKWSIKNLAAGQHIIRVEAQDNKGTNGSSSVTVTKQ